jgi:hypothetical protein
LRAGCRSCLAHSGSQKQDIGVLWMLDSNISLGVVHCRWPELICINARFKCETSAL